MSWSYFTLLLEKIQNYSTPLGLHWLTLVIFRIVLMAVGGKSIYADEQSKFVCNSTQRGCENMCYNDFAPLSHMHFWVFQIMFSTIPPLVYIPYAANKTSQKRENNSVWTAGRRQIHDDGLMQVYVLQLVIRLVLEASFLLVQHFLYGFHVAPIFVCSVKPCLHSVDCFVSRPTEKTIFLRTMYGLSYLSLLLNVLEIFHLGVGTILDYLKCKKSVTI